MRILCTLLCTLLVLLTACKTSEPSSSHRSNRACTIVLHAPETAGWTCEDEGQDVDMKLSDIAHVKTKDGGEKWCITVDPTTNKQGRALACSTIAPTAEERAADAVAAAKNAQAAGPQPTPQPAPQPAPVPAPPANPPGPGFTPQPVPVPAPAAGSGGHQ